MQDQSLLQSAGNIAVETESSSVGELLTAAAELMQGIGKALESEGACAEEAIQRAVAILFAGARAAKHKGGASSEQSHHVSHNQRGGLAPWQKRRLATHIDANLDSDLRVDELARLARLSPSHFVRAFSCSFGYSPHRFIVRQRVARAQSLMLTTRAPLQQIALDCGLADQAHLSRIFQRFVGESPGSWRRARAMPPP
jgi:transcriptional regulator GlxA family with amidase domain